MPTFLEHFGLFGAFLSMFVENIGIPFPTEFGYLIGSGLLITHKASLAVILLVLTAGHITGAIVAYFAGYHGSSWLLRRFKHSIKLRDTHTKVVKWYEQYGILTVLGTRFVGYVRPWSSFVAGSARFPFWPFVGLTLVGSFIFNIIALFASRTLIDIWNKYAQFHILIVLLMLLSFFGVIIYELIFQRKRSGNKGSPKSAKVENQTAKSVEIVQNQGDKQ